MSLFNPYGLQSKEFYYRASRFAESHWLHGIPVIFTPVSGYNTDVHNDPIPIYQEPLAINILIMNTPSATLEKKNWIAEGEPALMANISSINFPAYIKWRDSGADLDKVSDFMINVSRLSKIELPYKMMAEGENHYQITQVTGDAVRPFVWQCKLATVRESVDLDDSTPLIDRDTGRSTQLSTGLLNTELGFGHDANEDTIEGSKNSDHKSTS